MADTPVQPALEPQIRRRLQLGTFLGLLLVGTLGGWGSYASISSAIIAPGLVVVESSDKKVQHPTGGVVSALYVKSGDTVRAGDVLMRLDATQAKATLGVIHSQQTELLGRKARLEAQRDQAAGLVFPAGFEESSPEAANAAQSERRLFEAQAASKDGQKRQLTERIGQLRKEIEGLTVQLTAKRSEITLMNEEQDRVEELRKKELVPVTRQLSTDREVTRLQGEEGSLVSNIARAQGQISEIEVQIIGLDQTMISDAIKDLRDTEAKLSELAERRTAAQDQLDRIEIRAPRSGRINDLQVHTVGGVINPAETLMMIVPDDDKLAIEIKVAPTDIDQLTPGQHAVLRFSAFSQRTTPEIKGEISQIGANLTREPQSNVVYYLARVAISPDEQSKLKDLKLLPGMPVEAFIETGERRAMAYVLKPISDQVKRAFREE